MAQFLQEQPSPPSTCKSYAVLVCPLFALTLKGLFALWDHRTSLWVLPASLELPQALWFLRGGMGRPFSSTLEETCLTAQRCFLQTTCAQAAQQWHLGMKCRLCRWCSCHIYFLTKGPQGQWGPGVSAWIFLQVGGCKNCAGSSVSLGALEIPLSLPTCKREGVGSFNQPFWVCIGPCILQRDCVTMHEVGTGNLPKTRGLLCRTVKMTVPAPQLRWLSPLLVAMVQRRGDCNGTKEQNQLSVN